MSRSIVLFTEHQEILYENFITDLAAKLKNESNLDNISKRIDKLKQSYNINILKIEKQLVQNNIDINNIKDIVSKNINDIKIDIKSKDIKIITKSIISNFEDILKDVKKTLPEKIALSILTLVVVIVIGLFLSSILISIGLLIGLTPEVCGLIMPIFLSPLLEEYGKYISIKYNYTGSYFIVFNSVEFFMYIFSMLGKGLNLIPSIITRLLSVMMHAMTTYIQYYMRKNAKSDPEEASKIGLLIGIVIHFFWNLSSVII